MRMMADDDVTIRNKKSPWLSGRGLSTEEETDVIVCPNPKCIYKHIDGYGGTDIVSDLVTKDNQGVFRCYKYDTILFVAHKADSEVPFWLLKKNES